MLARCWMKRQVDCNYSSWQCLVLSPRQGRQSTPAHLLSIFWFLEVVPSCPSISLWGRFVPILIQQRLHISLSACWVVYISLINSFTDESMIWCSLFSLFPLKGWLTRARWRGGGSLKDGDDPEHLSELSLPVICEYHFNHFVSMFITFALIKMKCAPLIFLWSSNFSLSLGSEQICLFSLVVAV
jgi:hypothetical protein